MLLFRDDYHPNTEIVVNLPTSFEVVDYNEAVQILEIMKRIIPKVKIKELGIGAEDMPGDGNYVYMVYIGKLRDPKNRAMLKKLKSAL